MAADPMLEDDSDDEAPDSAADAGPAAASAPQPSPSPSPAPGPTPSASMSPQLRAYLEDKQAALDTAQKQAASNRLVTGIARAAGTLARGSGQVTAGDNAAYNALDAEANAPVSEVLTKQKAEADAVQSEQTEESTDPDSVKSKAVQSMIQKLYPGKYTPEQLKNISAADAQDVLFKPLELDEKIQSAKATRETANATRQAAQDAKHTAEQDKAYTTLRKDLETFRGNQSVQQAALAVQNADKALLLTQAQPTAQNLSLLADEMGKIATGGVPGEHGTQALMPSNLYTKVAEIKAWITGHPNASAADVTEYLNNNREYINQVKAVAQKALGSYRANIAKGYRHRVAPDDYQEAMDDYGLGGSQAQASEPGQPPAPQFTPDVVAYAQKHGITAAQANQIKIQRGGK